MRSRLLALLTALLVGLTGCSSLLDREYISITAHNTTPTAEGDPSVLRAESYQELVNALIYFVSQGMETGSVRLYLEGGDPQAELEAACLEVVQEDPLGAYAVEYIKYSISSIVTYDEADIQITYRRTKEQIDSISSVTGTTAIRNELESALSAFAPERVLRISYFDGDEDYIRSLCREAFLDNPASALDMPDIQVAIYPEAGRQRIVEILLTYHLETQELERRQDLLLALQAETVQALSATQGDPEIIAAARKIQSIASYSPDGGSTAYHAFLAGQADSLGMSLAMALLCQGLDVSWQVVPGTLDGQEHNWLVVLTQSGWMHLDMSTSVGWGTPFRTDQQMEQNGYQWNRDNVPACGPAAQEEAS